MHQTWEGERARGREGTKRRASGEIAAFDLAQESAQTRARYGLDRELAAGKDGAAFVSGCLMARRLLESGVDFVEVGLRGWDTHEDNFNRVRKLSEALDRGASALIDDLIANGLWSETLLVCVGDFGRTPRINGRGGRDHFPQISSVLLGGGPIQGGTVVGATDADGEEIVDRPVSVPDLFATLTAALGIDGGEVHVTPAGRPVTTVDETGSAVSELF